MPDLKISQLPAALTPLAGTELVPVVQGGITERTTVADFMSAGLPVSASTLSASGNVTLGDASTDTVRVNGYMGVGGAAATSAGIYVTNNALQTTNAIGIGSEPVANSANTNQITSFYAQPKTEASAFTVLNSNGFFAVDALKGAGSTITNQAGIRIANQTQGTNNYGLMSLVSAGANKWNIYASGTADNYFAGNIGLGVTPSAWSIIRAIQIGGAYGQSLFADNGSTQVGMASNAYYSSTGWKYFANNLATRYFQDIGNHYWSYAPSGTADAALTFTQLMTLSKEGNLGINTAPNTAWGPNTRAIEMSASSSSNVVARVNSMSVGTNYYIDSSANYDYAYTGQAATRYTMTFAGQHQWFTAPSGTVDTPISFTQVMTLDASGNLGIGTTAPGARLQVASSAYAAHFGEGSTNAGIDFRNRLGALPTTGTVATIAWLDSGSGFSAGSLLLGSRPAVGNVVLSASGAADVVINTSGNLGLGVLPSAWIAPNTVAIDFLRGAVSSSDGGPVDHIAISANAYSATSSDPGNTTWKYKRTGFAELYELRAGQHRWFNAPSGTAGNAITFTQAMVLDADGDLGVGTLAPAAKIESSVSSAGATAEVLRLSNPGAGANTQAQINFFTSAASYATITGGYGATAPQMTFNLPSVTAGNYVWQISGNERLRLDSSGNLISRVNSTAPSLSTNSTMSFELTSNTSLKVVVRGTDGVTRSVSLTLA